MTFPYEVCVLIGRFQPFHNGHLALLRLALAQAPLCVVVVGSAHSAASPKNPFSFDDRKAMIEQALRPDERERVRVVPVRDYYNESRWATAVEAAVASTMGTHKPTLIALLGHFKDESSSYLKAFPRWHLQSVPRQGDIDAAQVRKVLFELPAEALDKALALYAGQLPATTLAFLLQWIHKPAWDAMRLEATTIAHYKSLWRDAPYPPVFVTVDVVVVCQARVLLIQRGHAPGKGRYALPGGYLDQQETTWQSALRELLEETGLSADAIHAEKCLGGQHVFDHPARSLVGRIITHVYYFDLGERSLPAPTAGDDALSAEWFPISQLLQLEDRLHDDHFMILDHFLTLLPR